MVILYRVVLADCSGTEHKSAAFVAVREAWRLFNAVQSASVDNLAAVTQLREYLGMPAQGHQDSSEALTLLLDKVQEAIAEIRLSLLRDTRFRRWAELLQVRVASLQCLTVFCFQTDDISASVAKLIIAPHFQRDIDKVSWRHMVGLCLVDEKGKIDEERERKGNNARRDRNKGKAEEDKESMVFQEYPAQTRVKSAVLIPLLLHLDFKQEPPVGSLT